jgi:NADPH-dependent glutamate synthase beta subunit-like oxidoreductase
MVIRERIPFPAICGYVCFHPCENKCRRGQIDESIAIRALKRFAADHARKGDFMAQRIAPSSGKRVAVIGSGPAGLTAAYYLAKMGHTVTVFEALSEAGGMMRVGIPRYRLPKDVLDAEIDRIRQVGVEIRTNSQIESVNSLREQGYDAIFLALGAHAATQMAVVGEDSQGVIGCISMLRDVSLGRSVKLGKKVAIIGGGNAAIDASRTARRFGAKEVTILYRRSLDEMPASDEEIKKALEEGVKIEYLTAPVKISRQDGHLKVECIRMRLGTMDLSGRRRPEPVPGSRFEEDFNTVITATGQIPQIPEKMGVRVNQGGLLDTDPDTSKTNLRGVFAGGDMVSGPSSIIDSIAAGRQAAIAIDRYLGGEGLIEEKLAVPEDISALPEIIEEEEEKHRLEMPVLSLDKRLKGFDLVEIGFSEAMAREEAQRCLRCDIERD